MKQVKNGTFGFTQIVLTDMQSIHFLSCSIPAQRWCSYTKEHPGLFTSFGQKSLGRTSFSRHIIVASVGRNFRTSIFLLSIGITNWGGRLSTVDLPFKVTCFVKNVNNIFNIKWSWSKLVSSRRSNVPTLLFPFSKSSLPSIERMGDKVRWMDGSSWLSAKTFDQLTFDQMMLYRRCEPTNFTCKMVGFTNATCLWSMIWHERSACQGPILSNSNSRIFVIT